MSSFGIINSLEKENSRLLEVLKMRTERIQTLDLDMFERLAIEKAQPRVREFKLAQQIELMQLVNDVTDEVLAIAKNKV